MFMLALAFDSDLSGWDISAVTALGVCFDDDDLYWGDGMFEGNAWEVQAFNSDINGWDVPLESNLRPVSRCQHSLSVAGVDSPLLRSHVQRESVVR